MTQTDTIWQVYPQQQALAAKIGRHFHCSPIIGQLLLNRSIQTVSDAQAFLDRSWTAFPELPNQALFLSYFYDLIDHRTPICVYGDYDADGVTAISMMVQIIQSLGGIVDFIAPHRFNDGYGLNLNRMHEIARKKYGALITLDCGVSNRHEIDALKQLSPTIRVLMIDHHRCPDILPAADCIVNPQLAPSSHPARNLCTAALIDYIFRQSNNPSICMDDYCDLVAIGLVCDVMPLLGLNRWYVHRGIAHIRQTPRPSILELCVRARIHHSKLTAHDIGFSIGPRLNAAGRLGDPTPAVDFLCETDRHAVSAKGAVLDQLNMKRRSIGASIQTAIDSVINADTVKGTKGISCAGEFWHMGIIGINAARVVGKYHKPTVIIGYTDGIARGSARSIPGVNMHQILTECQDYLTHFGGHAQAAGFSLLPKNIPAFQKKYASVCQTMVSDKDLIPSQTVDQHIHLRDITIDFIESLSVLEPFGEGNPRPTFMATVRILEAKKVGQTGAHLKLRLEQDACIIDGIGFNLAHLIERCHHQAHCMFYVSINAFNGQLMPQIECIDIQ